MIFIVARISSFLEDFRVPIQSPLRSLFPPKTPFSPPMWRSEMAGSFLDVRRLFSSCRVTTTFLHVETSFQAVFFAFLLRVPQWLLLTPLACASPLTASWSLEVRFQLSWILRRLPFVSSAEVLSQSQRHTLRREDCE